MGQQVFDFTDYRALLRAKIKEARVRGQRLTLKRVASRIGIQYTYLSKAFRAAGTHLSEDAVFEICQILDFVGPEIQYTLLLRSLDVAQSKSRRKYLAGQLDHLKRSHQMVAELQPENGQPLSQELSYLLDPWAVVVYVSLNQPDYSKDPRKLSPLLGISPTYLREILSNLSRLGLIDLNENPLQVKRILKDKIHYGKNHPVMRAHQNLLRSHCLSRVMALPEEKKHSFMVTFGADQDGFDQVKIEFDQFVRRVEQVVNKIACRNIYQLNFDLFEWI